MRTKKTFLLSAASLLFSMIVSNFAYASCNSTIGNYSGDSSCPKVVSITSNHCTFGVPGFELTITVVLDRNGTLTPVGGSAQVHSYSKSGNNHYFVVSSSDPNYISLVANVVGCTGNFAAISIDNN